MTWSLAVRNVAKTWPKRLAFASFFAATMALLFLGNTIFENSDRGLQTTYVQSFAGQATLSASSPEQFTIFGSDLPLIGEYLVLPVLPNVADLVSRVSRALPDATVVPQVTAAASLDIGKLSIGVPVFGVEFTKYFHFFPALQLVRGQLPSSIEPEIMVTESQARSLEKKLGRPLVLGEPIVLNFAVGTSYVSRKVSLAGVFRYPTEDSLLQRIVLTDPDTARALDGYLYGDSGSVKLDSQSQKLMTANLDDLFGDSKQTNEPSSGAALSPDSLLSQIQTSPAPQVPARGRVEGAWNFLIVKSSKSDDEVLRVLKKSFPEQSLQVRDWRATAGGTAEIAWFLRILFNLGLLFIAFVSCLILVNSLSLSILERTKEIGTLRALGASRGFVARFIAWETLIVVVGAGILGILLGGGGIILLSHAHITLSNVYISALFGSQTLRLFLSGTSVLGHLVLVVILGLVALIWPVRKALAIEPVKAIAREQ